MTRSRSTWASSSTRMTWRGLRMSRHVALLHTSPFTWPTFDRLVKAADLALRVDHVVDESLLSAAQRFGVDDPRGH